MAENLSQALLITVVGMSLVFGAILLLWGTMAILVRLTSPAGQASEERLGNEDEMELKRQAAAAAVAVALELAEAGTPVHEFPLPRSADPAASQSVQKPGLQPLSPSQPGRQPAAATGDSLIKVVRAPIPGVIVSISVQPGSEVSTGQELCVLEAMKMKNTIRSTRSGKIASVSMQIGQHVKHHDVLMEYAE
jgi:biotin carboxyl carrier protein